MFYSKKRLLFTPFSMGDVLLGTIIFFEFLFVLLTPTNITVAKSSSQTAIVQSLSNDLMEYGYSENCVPEVSGACVIEAELNFTYDPNIESGLRGLLLASYSGIPTIVVNGHFIPIPENKNQHFARSISPPVLILLEESFLVSGRNTVALSISTTAPLGARLNRVLIGSVASVKNEFEFQKLLREDIFNFAKGGLLTIALLASFVAMRTRYSNHILFSIMSMGLAVPLFSDIFAIWLPITVVRALGAMSFFSVCLAPHFLSSLGNVKSPISLQTILVMPIVLVVAKISVLIELPEVVQLGKIFLINLLGLSILNAVFILLQSIKMQQSQRTLVVPLFAIAIISLLALHLWGPLGVFPSFLGELVFFGPIVSAILSAVFFIHVNLVFLSEIRDATTAMQKEVARVTTSLNEQHKRIEKQKRETVLQQERERLMGDLHDGLAGNLIAIKSLVLDEVGAGADAIRELTQKAILDLRLVVDSMDNFDGDFRSVLAAFKERIAPQLSSSVVTIHWSVPKDIYWLEMTPEKNLAIFRILQEAISNAVRHGPARNIWIVVRIAVSPNAHMKIFIVDDGCSNVQTSEGFGLTNMRRRAAKLGGKIMKRFGDKGTVILLRF